MVKLEGVHGTSKGFSEVIEKDGFRIGKGRLGTGAYFWRQGKYARQLAVGWFVFRRNRTEYGEENPKCVVIYVGIECEDAELLDLLNPEVREELARLVASQRLGTDITDRQTAALYDLFVERFEAKLKTKFKVLQSGAAPPPNTPYPMKVLGAPLALLARDPKSISIVRKEEVPDGELKQYA